MNETQTDDRPNEESHYVPLSERLNQDVFHDNIVPKYSGLASARPSNVIIIGVWIIFLPMAFVALSLLFAAFNGTNNFAGGLIQAIGSLIVLTFVVTLLFKQTRRYLHWRQAKKLD
jgi:hypothetical protein